MALNLINRSARVKFNTDTNDNLEPPKEFVYHLANQLQSYKEFVQDLAFDIGAFEANEDPGEEVDEGYTTLFGSLKSVSLL